MRSAGASRSVGTPSVRPCAVSPSAAPGVSSVYAIPARSSSGISASSTATPPPTGASAALSAPVADVMYSRPIARSYESPATLPNGDAT